MTADPPGLSYPPAAALAAMLAVALTPDVALVVPLRPGRKHLLPGALWGRVTTGDAGLSWTAGDVARLAALRRLRRDGFTAPALAAPAPAFTVLRRVPAGRVPGVLADWAELGEWRARRPWLDLALRVTAVAPR